MAEVAVMVRDKLRLTPEQREELRRLIRVGKSTARVSARVRILLTVGRRPGWLKGWMWR